MIKWPSNISNPPLSTPERMCEFEFKLVDYTGTPTTNNTGLLVASKVGTRKVSTVEKTIVTAVL